jgi:hypothetical protein
MTDLTEDDEFNLLLDDEWDVDPPMRRTTTQKPSSPVCEPSCWRRAPVDSELANGRALSAALVASDPSIEPALEPVQLFDGIRKGGRDVGSGSRV